MRERIGAALLAGALTLSGCSDAQIGGTDGTNPLDCSKETVFETAIALPRGEAFNIGGLGFIFLGDGALKVDAIRSGFSGLIVESEESNKSPIYEENFVHLNPDGTFTWLYEGIKFTASGVEGDGRTTIVNLKEECSPS